MEPHLRRDAQRDQRLIEDRASHMNCATERNSRPIGIVLGVFFFALALVRLFALFVVFPVLRVIVRERGPSLGRESGRGHSTNRKECS